MQRDALRGWGRAGFPRQVARIGADGLLQQFVKLASVDLVSVTVGGGLLAAVNALGLGQVRAAAMRTRARERVPVFDADGIEWI